MGRRDPAFRFEQRAALNAQVDNPFFGYLTPDKFPGALRNNRQVTLGSLLVPYPQYGDINQTNTNGRQLRTHTAEIRAQRPFAKGLSFLAAYAWNHERIQETLDNIAQYRVLTSGGEDGWEWRPTDLPVHRFTTAVTWAGADRPRSCVPVDAARRDRLCDRRLAVHGRDSLLLRREIQIDVRFAF